MKAFSILSVGSESEKFDMFYTSCLYVKMFQACNLNFDNYGLQKIYLEILEYFVSNLSKLVYPYQESQSGPVHAFTFKGKIAKLTVVQKTLVDTLSWRR